MNVERTAFFEAKDIRRRESLRRCALLLVLLTLGMLAVGISLLASASSHISASESPGIFQSLATRQALFAIPGLLIAALMVKVPLSVWKNKKVVYTIAGISLVLIWITLIPAPFTVYANGSRRWIKLPFGVRLQTSELVKFSVVLLAAFYINFYRHRMHEWWRGLIIPLIVLGLFVLPIFGQPDFGTTAVISVVLLIMLYMGGVRLGPLLIMSVAGLIVFMGAILFDTERTSRLVAFTDPDKYQEGEAHQLISSITGFIMGGAKGVGYNAGLQKVGYLPEPHTDFIFAVIGEEMGMRATVSILTLFAIMFLLGIRIAQRAPEGFMRQFALGLTMMFTVQTLVNIAVVTGMLPTKGIGLPFFSYGGSNLVISLAMMGCIIAVGRQCGSPESLQKSTPVKDRAQWA